MTLATKRSSAHWDGKARYIRRRSRATVLTDRAVITTAQPQIPRVSHGAIGWQGQNSIQFEIRVSVPEMARRSSPLDDAFEVARRLSPGVAIGLAVISFVVLHALARTAPLAPLFQLLIPGVLIAGALASMLRGERGRNLLDAAAGDPTRIVSSLSWRDFERLVAAYFERSGYQVEHTGGGGPDGGIDIALKQGRELTLVQCKQWRAQKVSVPIVRELYGVMAAKGAARGIIVSAGEFTPDAREFASGRNIDLISGQVLADLLRHEDQKEALPPPISTPTCPACRSQMIMRTARRGVYSGQPFWGCKTYPACKAILPIPS
jgi:restriction system protein